MIFFPAIDLKDGQCVRLLQGDMKHATIYSCDPAGQARQFMQCGCEWLHVVDLNGAFEGRPVNGGAVDGILTATDMPVQLGGGIRDLATAANWLERGVRRVILGTAAVRDPDFVHDACRQFAGQVALGIDARAGRVAVEGWAEVSEMTTLTCSHAVRVELPNRHMPVPAGQAHKEVVPDGEKALGAPRPPISS